MLLVEWKNRHLSCIIGWFYLPDFGKIGRCQRRCIGRLIHILSIIGRIIGWLMWRIMSLLRRCLGVLRRGLWSIICLTISFTTSVSSSTLRNTGIVNSCMMWPLGWNLDILVVTRISAWSTMKKRRSSRCTSSYRGLWGSVSTCFNSRWSRVRSTGWPLIWRRIRFLVTIMCVTTWRRNLCTWRRLKWKRLRYRRNSWWGRCFLSIRWYIGRLRMMLSIATIRGLKKE